MFSKFRSSSPGFLHKSSSSSSSSSSKRRTGEIQGPDGPIPAVFLCPPTEFEVEPEQINDLEELAPSAYGQIVKGTGIIQIQESAGGVDVSGDLAEGESSAEGDREEKLDLDRRAGERIEEPSSVFHISDEPEPAPSQSLPDLDPSPSSEPIHRVTSAGSLHHPNPVMLVDPEAPLPTTSRRQKIRDMFQSLQNPTKRAGLSPAQISYESDVPEPTNSASSAGEADDLWEDAHYHEPIKLPSFKSLRSRKNSKAEQPPVR